MEGLPPSRSKRKHTDTQGYSLSYLEATGARLERNRSPGNNANSPYPVGVGIEKEIEMNNTDEMDVTQTCPKCGLEQKVSPSYADYIHRYGCYECRQKDIEKADKTCPVAESE